MASERQQFVDPLGSGLVRRPRLSSMIERLDAGGVALAVAPAGSGKSVLLSQWAGDDEVSWLDTTAAHDDAVVLGRELCAALHRHHADFDPDIARLVIDGGSRLGAVFVDAFVVELAALARPATIVIDDLHRITNAPLVSDIGDILLRLPERTRVLIGARWDPALHISRLRVAGRVVEARATDLACTAEEGRELLEQMSALPLEPSQTGSVVARTEGWMAGLVLAGLSMRAVDDVDAFIESFRGDDRLVADYLSDEVLRGLQPDVRRFLLDTCVLGWLSSELCDAVTGRCDSHEMLQRLVAAGTFITRTSSGENRYRYHHLFADLLRFQLHMEDPGAERALRGRAADWLLAHDELEDAVEQMLSAGDPAEAFAAISTHGHRLFERGDAATLVRWLTTVRDRTTAPSADVSVSLLAAQVAADDFTGAAESYRRQSGTAMSAGEAAAVDTLGALLVHHDLALPEVQRRADRALAALEHLDPAEVPDFLGVGGAESCATMAAYSHALASLLADDAVTAIDHFRAVVEHPGLGYAVWRVSANSALALSLAMCGEVGAAKRIAALALETACDLDTLDHKSATMSHLALAIVELDRADPVAASPHLDASSICTSTSRRPTVNHLLQSELARSVALTEGATRGLELLRTDRTPGALRPIAARRRLALEVQLLLRCGATGEAVDVLRRSAVVVPPQHIDALLAHGDICTARKVLDEWRPVPGDHRASLEHQLRTSAVLQREGAVGPARTKLTNAATSAETSDLLAPVLDSPHTIDLLRRAVPLNQFPQLRVRLDAPRIADDRASAAGRLVEPLTERELAVLAYLPTRLTNSEIAASLYVSVNTLKTHLRNTYRKLGVADRNSAVSAAMELGLI